MRIFARRIAVVVLVCFAVTPAAAQAPSNATRTFVDVTLGPDWDDTRSIRVPGATWRAGLAIGFDRGSSGFELGVGVPQWHVEHRGPRQYQFVGRSSGWQRQGHTYESSTTVRHRSIDVTLMFRVNRAVNRHFALTWLVGGGYVYRPKQESGVENEVLPDGRRVEVNTHRSTSSRNYSVGTTGLDAELKVTPRLSVVPRVRVTVYPSLLDDSGSAPRMVTARPEIAARWRF